MSVTQAQAKELGCSTDRPELLAAVQFALQGFLNQMAAEGFKLPLEISLHDSDGDTLRDFTVERGGKITLRHTTDALALYVWPLAAIATDPSGRIAVMRLEVAESDPDAVVTDTKVEFLN